MIVLINILLLSSPRLAVRAMSVASSSSSSPTTLVGLHWFRKGLRLHDNPALMESLSTHKVSKLFPVYILEPGLEKRDIGINRYTHTLQTLEDLDSSLRRLGSRLFLLQGDTEEQLRKALLEWKVDVLSFEADSEPSFKGMREAVDRMAMELGVKVVEKTSHTLYSPEEYIEQSQKKKISFNSYVTFCRLFLAMGTVRKPLPAPDHLPQVLLYYEPSQLLTGKTF